MGGSTFPRPRPRVRVRVRSRAKSEGHLDAAVVSVKPWRWGGAGALAVALTLLTGCAPSADSAGVGQIGETRVAAPLLGYHQLIASVPLEGSGTRPATLISASPTDPYNVAVMHAWVVPIDKSAGIEGVLRWPRAATDHIPGIEVLQQARQLRGFVLPQRSHEQWMITIIVRQRDPSRSMRATGVAATYSVDGQHRTTDLTMGFCFTTPTDKTACPH